MYRKLEPQIAAPSASPKGHPATPASRGPRCGDDKGGGECSADAALVEIIRGRLEGLGPVTVEALADSSGIPINDVETALAKLATEGVAMRGFYSPDAPQAESPVVNQ